MCFLSMLGIQEAYGLDESVEFTEVILFVAETDVSDFSTHPKLSEFYYQKISRDLWKSNLF